jgi:hypothetical protein
MTSQVVRSSPAARAATAHQADADNGHNDINRGNNANINDKVRLTRYPAQMSAGVHESKNGELRKLLLLTQAKNLSGVWIKSACPC